jgi:hypothetical protein
MTGMALSEVQESRRNSLLDDETQTLLAPGIFDDLRTIFKEALTDSLARMLDQNEARALMLYLAGTNLEPDGVFRELDSILGAGSAILKVAIAEEFRANAHLLLKKAKGRLAIDTYPLMEPIFDDHLGP